MEGVLEVERGKNAGWQCGGMGRGSDKGGRGQAVGRSHSGIITVMSHPHISLHSTCSTFPPLLFPPLLSLPSPPSSRLCSATYLLPRWLPAPACVARGALPPAARPCGCGTRRCCAPCWPCQLPRSEWPSRLASTTSSGERRMRETKWKREEEREEEKVARRGWGRGAGIGIGKRREERGGRRGLGRGEGGEGEVKWEGERRRDGG